MNFIKSRAEDDVWHAELRSQGRGKAKGSQRSEQMDHREE